MNGQHEEVIDLMREVASLKEELASTTKFAARLATQTVNLKSDVGRLRSLLLEARDVLRGLEERHEPGVFCDHAAAPCPRCSKAYAVLARLDEEVGGHG